MLAKFSDWMVSNTGSAVGTWIGTILGLSGIVYTIIQVTRAKRIAEEVQAAIKIRDTVFNIGTLVYAYAHIELVKNLIQGNQLAPAQTVFHMLKRMVIEVCDHLATQADLAGQISVTNHNVKIVEKQLDLGINGSSGYKHHTLIMALSGIGTFLATHERSVRDMRS